MKPQTRNAVLLLLCAAAIDLPAQETSNPTPGGASPAGNAGTVHETGQQYKQGNTLTGAGDNRLIGRQALADSDLAGKKALLNTKLNTFIAFFNNPFAGTQFEKFLNAPAESSEAASTYRQRIATIMDLLSPGNATKENQDTAYNLLPKASEFESDANLCTTIHDAVYAAANSRVEVERLTQLNEGLEKQRTIAEYNNLQAARDIPLSAVATTKSDEANNNANLQAEREARMEPTKREVASVSQTIERNKMEIASAEAQAKFQFQALILQLFVQRRYQHVIIANRFYRALFDDGDQSLETFQKMANDLAYNRDAGQLKLIAKADPNVAGSSGGGGAGFGTGSNGSGAAIGGGNNGGDGSAFSASGMQLGLENASVESLMNAVSSGMKTVSKTFKTLSQLDGISNEIIRDVDEGVNVYKYLLSQNEVEAATAQLVSIWTKGEYLPSVRLLTQDEKRSSLKYAQLVNKLITSANSGNIDTMSEAVAEMKKQASDFDDTEILANIEATKVASSMHIAQARVAASKDDLQTVQSEITRAASLWPNNPELRNFSTDMSKLSEQASPEVQALNDFDQLYDQKNFRQIFNDKEKYIAAIAQSPERQDKLKQALSQMEDIETSIMRSQEIARRGDYAGAWEGLEATSIKYPDDSKLNQMRADLTTQAPDFVHDLHEAQSYEDKKEYGSALAWYLRSQSRYPMSDLAKEGIERVVKQIVPDAS
jgi:hypothetical protein